MPKILDDQLWATLQEYENIKSDRLRLEKLEKRMKDMERKPESGLIHLYN